jgi:hypothetical protein
MSATLLGVGLACLIAAIVGGGFKAFGVEVPLVQSLGRQSLLAVVGLGLVGTAVALERVQLEASRSAAPAPGLVASAAAEKPPSDQAISAAEANKRAEDAYAKEDYRAAVNWWRRAANLGDKFAMANMGVMYEAGRGVPLDYSEAMRWYLQADTQAGGHSGAEKNIAQMYESGNGVPPNLAEARRWYERAAEKDEPISRQWLAAHPA